MGILVEGLNDDKLQLLESYFTDGGFKRLRDRGVTITDVDFGPGIDGAAAAAIVYTGAAPGVNGIPAARVYDPVSQRATGVMLDSTMMGNFTDETYSPRALRVSTLADELLLDAAGTGMVHSLAPNPAEAIIMSGHAGNSAFWINDNTGKWATTTHYKDVPRTMTARNYQRPLPSMLDTMAWTPLLSPESYPDLPSFKRQYPFRHTFSRKEVDRVTRYKASPKSNTEITQAALEYLRDMPLGKREPIDMLNMEYTVAPYPYTRDGDNRMETLDSYLRLDRDLDRLLKAVDSKVGPDGALVYVVGYPSAPGSASDSLPGMTTGRFSPRKAMSLLNMYLMALHGNGQWVGGYYDRNFYLNTRQIKESALDIQAVRAEAAEFLDRMSGVASVHTIDDIIASRAGDNAGARKRNTSVEHSGDVVINITPGWTVVDDVNPGIHRPVVARDSFTPSVAFIMAPGVTPRTIDGTTDARVIAPTVARLLRIRSPNAASMPPLRL